MAERSLSLPKSVAAAGISWNEQPSLKQLGHVGHVVHGHNSRAVEQVHSVGSSVYLWAYMYAQAASRNVDLVYATILAEPSTLLPVVYTQTLWACPFKRIPAATSVYVSMQVSWLAPNLSLALAELALVYLGPW